MQETLIEEKRKLYSPYMGTAIAVLLYLLMFFSIRTGTVFAAEEIAGEERTDPRHDR